MKPYAIGIDLGGTIVKIGLVCNGKIIAVKTLDADSGNGLECKLPSMTTVIEGLLTEYSVSRDQFAGIGFCFPGLADSKRGKVTSTNAKYDDATEVDIEGWAKSIYGGEFYIDNDARMSTVGEWKYGAGQGCDNLVMVTIGTGIGCGVVIEGLLLRGAHHQAGCLGGHLVADYRGRKCSCGNIGCVEASASSFFLNDIVRENSNVSSDFYADYAPFDFKKIFTLSREGNNDAIIIRNECMDIWAAGLISLIHAYDPEKIVIGGGIMRSADIIVPYIQNRVNNLAWTPWGKIEIVASELMDNSAILGVSNIVYNLNK